MKLRFYPSQSLTTPCKPVVFPDRDVQQARQMREFARRCAGYALAANQVGIGKRFFVLAEHDVTKRAPWFVANPEIVSSEGEYVYEESCLSLPGLRFKVARPDAIVVAYQDENGVAKTFECKHVLSRIFQHEIDHLSGRLFLDRLNPDQLKVAMAKLPKVPPTVRSIAAALANVNDAPSKIASKPPLF